jgi:hypothetical protein
MRSSAPKLCVEIGKYGLLAFATPVRSSALVRMADAFELKTPHHLAQVHALRTGSAAAQNAEQQRLAEILATGKELIYHGSGIFDNGFTEQFAAAGHVGRLGPAGIKYASFSIGPGCLKTLKRSRDELVFEQPLSRDELRRHADDRLRTLRAGFSGQLGFENELFQPGGGMNHVTDPAFISEFFRAYPAVTFLLDIAHARVSANAMEIDVIEYLRGLPLDRVDHIHLSHPAWLKLLGAHSPTLVDAHEAPQDEDFAYLDLALSLTARPSYLTVEYFRDEAALVESCRQLRQFFQPTIKVPLARNFALLNYSLEAARERLAALDYYDRGQISRIIKEHTEAKEEAIFEEIQALESRRGVVFDSPKNVAVHISNVETAYVQATTASYEELAASADPQQLERICLCQDRARGKGNLARLKASLARYAAFLWQTLVFRHDDGKVISAPLHERETGELLRKFRILDTPAYARLSVKEKALLTEIMEHHAPLGSSYIGDNSMLIFKEVFECPRMRGLLEGPEGKIDLEAARMLLEMWAAFTCLDASGLGPKGMLTNSRLEYYYQTTSDLYDIFERNAADYDAALMEIEAYAQGSFLARLCEIMVSFDSKGDSKVLPWKKDLSHFSFYLRNIEEALAGLTARGEITGADWEELRNTFHRVIELPYIASWYNIAWSNPGVDKSSPQADAKIYDGFLKYLVLLNKAAAGCREICVIKGEGQGVIRSVTDLDAYLPKLRPVIDRARGLVTEVDLTYFADAGGQKIEDSPFIYKQGTSLIVDLLPTGPGAKK